MTGGAEVTAEDAELARLVEARDWVGVDEILRPLAVAAADGSTDSLERLVYVVDRHRLVHGPVWAVVSDPDAVEDAAQEAVVALLRGIHTFRGDAMFTTWLFQVARRAAMASLRPRRTDGVTGVAEPESGLCRSLSSVVTDRLALDRAIAGLDPVFRDPLLLRERDHLPYDVIAERLEVPVGTVRSRIARARARLAVLLGGGEEAAG